MKKLSLILAVLLLVSLFSAQVLAADGAPGSYNKFGSKAYGMGGAFTAVADDATAVYWNPAGLTQSDLVGLQANFGSQLGNWSDISDIGDFIDAVEDEDYEKANELEDDLEDIDPINVNGMAAANLSSIGVGVIGNSRLDFDSSTPKATNDVLVQGLGGYGTEIIDPPLVGSLSIGGTGKVLYNRLDEAEIDIQEGETEFTDQDTTGYGADIGALATLTDIDILNAKAGVTMRNAFNTLDELDEGRNNPALERTLTLGSGVTFKFPMVEVLSARVAADMEMPLEGDRDNIKRLGAEGTIGLFSLRTGVYGTDLGESDERTATLGAGFNLPFVDFNIAADSDSYVNFSGTFNF